MTTPPVKTPLPLVSVCIPTFNNVAMVGDALRSALAQTYPVLEILVLDNASTDHTEQLVRATAKADQRVRYIRHFENIGMARNFTSAVHAAGGEFVMILCADDVLEPDGISTLVRALSATPSATLVAGGRTIVDESLRPIGHDRPSVRPRLASRRELAVACLSRGNRIGEPSVVLFRRNAAERGFNVDYNQFVDLEMWMHLLSQGDAVLLPMPVARIRRHAGQWSQENIRNGRLVADKRSFFRMLRPSIQATLSTTDKLGWDLRMCSSVLKTRIAGLALPSRSIDEVFYPALVRCTLAALTPTASALGWWKARNPSGLQRPGEHE